MNPSPIKLGIRTARQKTKEKKTELISKKWSDFPMKKITFLTWESLLHLISNSMSLLSNVKQAIKPGQVKVSQSGITKGITKGCRKRGFKTWLQWMVRPTLFFLSEGLLYSFFGSMTHNSARNARKIDIELSCNMRSEFQKRKEAKKLNCQALWKGKRIHLCINLFLC